MRKSRLIQHYNDKQASFHVYFKRILESQEIEDIHQLRLNIKKLRVTWSLMDMASQGMLNKKGYFSLISKLFDEAGEVRDAQMSLSKIGKSKAMYLVPYAEYLREAQRCANGKLLTGMQAFDFKTLEMLNNKLLQEMKGLSDEIALRKSATFFLKETSKVRELKDHLPDNRKLHKIRIHLKAIREILTIMIELNDTEGLDELQNNIKSLEQQIGKWHDYIMLRTSLKNFVDQNLNKKGVRYITNLIGRIEYQQEVRQQNIYRLINTFITQQQLKQIENFL